MTQADMTSHDSTGGKHDLEARLASIGQTLADRIRDVVANIPGSPQGPVQIARKLGVDKVLASRVLKAAQKRDPIAALHLSPGPGPLRRLLSAAGRHGVPHELVQRAQQAVDDFDSIVRNSIGDRRALDTIISAWLPEARQEFELRRKQAAFRAMSELLGSMADLDIASVFVHPSEDGENLDIIWVCGLIGLRRLRAGSRVKFATRRMGESGPPRWPQTLDGETVEDYEGLRLDEFCSKPPVNLEAHRNGDVVQYTLAGNEFGPNSATDLVFAEVNRAEIPIDVDPQERPKRQLFAEISTPVSVVVFNAIIHESVFRGREPSLYIYDTALDGVADVNDRARDLDRLNLCETLQPLGKGIAKFRVMEFPRYAELLRHVCDKLKWDGDAFRGYRCRIDYPLYGSQIVIAWDSVAPGATQAT